MFARYFPGRHDISSIGVRGERERYDNNKVKFVTGEIGDNFRTFSDG